MYMAACTLLCSKSSWAPALLVVYHVEECYFEAEMLVGQQEIRRRLLWSGLGEGCWKSKCQNKRQKDGPQTSELV